MCFPGKHGFDRLVKPTEVCFETVRRLSECVCETTTQMGVVLVRFRTDMCGFAKTSKVCCEELHGVPPLSIQRFRVRPYSEVGH